MTTNLSRTLVNKCLFGIKNYNQQPKRLESFKAAVFKENTLALEDVKLKKLEKDQVRVQVNYCSVNTNDVAQFENSMIKDFVPGYELSGEVLEIGANVKADIVTVGERVAVLSQNRGGFAEQCVVNAHDVWRLPSKIKRKDAAVLIYGHTNAMYAFAHLCPVKEDSSVVISSGPAGLGLAAIDIAANIYKVKPIGLSDNEEVLTLIRERGAFKTMTFESKRLAKELKNVDIIYDAVGDTYKYLHDCLKPDGKILCAGPMNLSITTPPLNRWLSVVNFEGLRLTNLDLYRTLVSDILELADQGMISAHVSAVFTLDKVEDAVKYIQANKCNGKVLINVID